MDDTDLFDVLRSYPQIYFACHVQHRTRASSPTGLTAHDASLLAHIDDRAGSSPSLLARHLGVARSTLSAALARLEARGLLSIERDASDARRRLVRLTAEGRAAIVRDSVLDPDRVAALLATMGAKERRAAVAGLKALADAARTLRQGEG